MKLIHSIALIQILVFTLDFCSASENASVFNGSWYEITGRRFIPRGFLVKLGVSSELSKKYEEGKALKLKISPDPKYEWYNISGYDPLGKHFTFELKDKSDKFRSIYVGDKYRLSSKLSIYLPKLYLSIYTKGSRDSQIAEIETYVNSRKELILKLTNFDTKDYLETAFRSVKRFNDTTVYNH